MEWPISIGSQVRAVFFIVGGHLQRVVSRAQETAALPRPYRAVCVGVLLRQRHKGRQLGAVVPQIRRGPRHTCGKSVADAAISPEAIFGYGLPVSIACAPTVWMLLSCVTDRMMAYLSAILANNGNCSLISIPGTLVFIGLNSPRRSAGASGLRSNVSCWGGPPDA